MNRRIGTLCIVGLSGGELIIIIPDDDDDEWDCAPWCEPMLAAPTEELFFTPPPPPMDDAPGADPEPPDDLNGWCSFLDGLGDG